jgi:RNA polymerase sigma-70 factor (ECF subfamily)
VKPSPALQALLDALGALDATQRPSDDTARADAAARVDEIVRAGEQAWPGLRAPSPQEVGAALAERFLRRPDQDLPTWLARVHAADLYLALMCARGDDLAIAAFERAYRADIERLIARYRGPELSAEDLWQTLREKLFVSSVQREGRIRDYTGIGFLQNWLRVTASRTFIDALRAATAATRRDDTQPLNEQVLMGLDIPAAAIEPELDFLKQEYRAHFKEAFAAALASLTSHERNLLRQHLLGGLTMAQIGALFQVHTSTISRQISRARDALLERTREGMRARLRLTEDELADMLGMIRSHLDLSIHRLLHTHPTTPPSE